MISVCSLILGLAFGLSFGLLDVEDTTYHSPGRAINAPRNDDDYKAVDHGDTFTRFGCSS